MLIALVVVACGGTEGSEQAEPTATTGVAELGSTSDGGNGGSGGGAPSPTTSTPPTAPGGTAGEFGEPAPPTAPGGTAGGFGEPSPTTIDERTLQDCLDEARSLADAGEWQAARDALRCILDDPTDLPDDIVGEAQALDQLAASTLAGPDVSSTPEGTAGDDDTDDEG